MAAFLVIIAVAAWWRNRPRRERASRPAPDSRPIEPAPEGDDILAWTARVRAALTERFGLAWAARTTEEIAASDELAARIGPERFADLVAFLRTADRVKFGGHAMPDPAWRDQAGRFLAWIGTDGSPVAAP